jgi:hypothetical protein
VVCYTRAGRRVMKPTRYIFHVDVKFSSEDRLEFTDADYQFFGDGDLERGKRNVEAAIERLARKIDEQVLNDLK